MKTNFEILRKMNGFLMLAMRFAQGEITEKEFERMMALFKKHGVAR
jgi:uncharacterized membrane protein